jgi:hypothetical protein
MPKRLTMRRFARFIRKLSNYEKSNIIWQKTRKESHIGQSQNRANLKNQF